MKRTVAVLLIVLLVCMMFTGCIKKNRDPVLGSWRGVYIKFVADSEENEYAEDQFYLDLEKGGKGTHHRDNLDFDIVWALDGKDFTMTETYAGLTVVYKGKMTGEKLDIFNGDPEDPWTCEYVYEKVPER